MNARESIPKTSISEETLLLLEPVFKGEILLKEQHYSAARAQYQEALGVFPAGSGGRFLVYNKLGIACEKLGETDEAILAYEEGIREGSITPFPYYRLACIHMDAERCSEALDFCDRGIKSLKSANTTFWEEMYFWVKFRRLRRKIVRGNRA